MSEIAIVHCEVGWLAMGATLMRILIEMINAAGVEGGGAAVDAMHAVALFKQELHQIGAVLSGDSGDEGRFHDGIRDCTQPA